MGIRLVEPTDYRESDKAECVRQLDIAGTPSSVLLDNVERQTRIIGLAADGLYAEFVRAHPQDPRRRYANILYAANEQLRQDLGALLAALRSEG